ncbi:hypothetical protein HTZ84_10285 [Haloterrigena sp. SYSU A558-1]|uniref:WD40 repeat domain-containing protein n=1 Tax=Haloterrigena gelatinilytica TaxID=2741724 RepID=A0ABX2LEA9_9EURY|nr:hypothetical protein [Haloterrigena gelatinilytica]NUC72693.1 hypothetical protein [Haloterrigena gelatinilytica]
MIDRLDDSLSDALEWLQRVGSPGTADDASESGDDRTEADGDRRSDGDDGGEGDADAADRTTDADAGDGADDRGDWEAVESPTSRTLHGVVHGQDGPYACGEGGLLLHRTGDGWRVVLERGPGVSENTLRSIAATDDGCRLWFAGDSGALGFYDVADGHLSDYSAPMEKTSTWEAIAVAGRTGEERVRIANGSGEVLDCTVEDGCPVWGEVVEPGGGSTIPGITAGPDGFYAIDTSGGAYREAAAGDATAAGTDGSTERDPRDGEPEDTEPTDTEPTDEWDRIGVRNAQVDFQDVRAGDESVFIAGADGIAYRYDPDCENWTPLHVGQGALQAIRSRGTDTVAVANGGRIYERAASVRWTELDVPTEQSLLGLALARSSADSDGLGTVPVDVAVGAGGAILERDRRERPTDGDHRE